MTVADTAYQALKTMPQHLQHEVLDFIEFIQQKNSANEENKTQRLQRIMQALEKNNAFSDIENPDEWQREIRQDRELPR